MLKTIGKRIVALLCAVSIVMTSIGFVFPAEAATSLETLNSSLEQFTFSDWPTDISGTYKMNGSGWVLLKEYFGKNGTAGAFAGKVLNGYVTFGSDPFNFRLGNSASMWVNDKFAFYRDANTPAEALNFGFNGTVYTLTSEKAKTDLVDSPFNLKISFEEIDTDANGKMDRLKLGLWFNDILYDNQYFTVDGDYSAFVHGCVYINGLGQGNGYVTLDTNASLNPAFEQFTFSDFIEDISGTYRMNGSGWVLLKEYFSKGTTAGAFAGKVLNGYVTFGSDPFNFRLGDSTSMWVNDKFAFYRDANTPAESLNFGFDGTTYELTSEKAKTDLVDSPFNLKISFEEVDTNADGTKDRLRLGLWFNDILYDNKYFTVDGDYSAFVHGCVYINGLGQGNGYVTLDTSASLNPAFEQFTFSDFTEDISGTYRMNGSGWVLLKEYFGKNGTAGAFAGKVLNGYVTFGSDPFNFRLGDSTSMWVNDKFAFYRDANTPAEALNFGFNGTTYELTSEKAKTDLVDSPFNLKISFEEVDRNADGTKDRLQLGLWFNDILYDNQYFTVDGDYSAFVHGCVYINGLGQGNGYVTLVSNKDGEREKEGTSITETNSGDMNRVPYNNDEITADLGVGAASYVAVVDKNKDGYMDLMVGSNCVPYGGTHIFYGSAKSQNNSSGEYLLMDKGRQIAQYGNTFYASYLYKSNGSYDKTMLIGARDPEINSNSWAVLDAADYPTTFTRLTGRPGVGIPQEILDMGFTDAFNPWTMAMADYDGDGDLDWITGWGNWEEYSSLGTNVSGDKFDNNGVWGDDNGDGIGDDDGDGDDDPLHSWVMWNENLDPNQGANGVGAATYDTENTKGKLVYVYDYEMIGGVKTIVANTQKPLDVYGCGCPQLRDWDGDGDLDIVCASFIGELVYFENIGTKTEPLYINGRSLVLADGSNAELELAMPVITAFDWNNDGYMDLICGEEDGRVCLVEHSGTFDSNGTPIMKDLQFFQTPADSVKDGVLNTPYSIDWDGDGDEDIISGNSAGFISLIENVTIKDGKLKGDLADPIWAKPVRFTNPDGEVYRFMAGYNGSIQGPAEAKWGYTQVSVADWDGDGILDVMSSNSSGRVFVHRGIEGEKHQLEDPIPVEVEWENGNKYPTWNWWKPNGNELVTQWRVTPYMIDLPLDEDGDGVAKGDGLIDLVMMDHEGYLTFFQRYKDKDGNLKLKEGQRIFKLSDGTTALNFNTNAEGKSGKVAYALVDFDQDGDIDILRSSDVNIGYYDNISFKAGEYKFSAMPVHVHDRMLADHTPSPTICDWNGDDVPDLLVGTMDGHLYYMVNNIAEEPYVEPENPEKLDPTLEQITFDDFNIVNEKYEHVPGKDFVATGDYNGAAKGSLANKVLNGNITFSEHAWLYIGGDDGLWSGFSIRGNGGDLILTFGGQEHTIKAKIAKTQLVGKEFNLKLSLQVEGDKLKLGVWINDTLYKNEYFETENYEKYLYGRLGIFPPWEGTYIEIESVTEKFVGHKEKLDSSLEQLTFDDFNISNGKYKHNPDKDFVATGDYNGAAAGSLANKVINGNITFSEHSWLYVGGDDGLWSGLSLRGSGDNLILTFGGKEYPIKSGVVGEKLVGNKFNLKLSYEVEDDKLKLGVWINDKLYKDEYFEAENYEKYLYGRLGIFPPWEGTYIEIESVTEAFVGHKEKLNSSLEQLTFDDFNISNGKYKHDPKKDFVATGDYNGAAKGSLANKVINGNITFSEHSWLYVGGDDGLWSGLSLRGSGDNLILTFGGKEYPIKSAVVGEKLVGNKFNLKLSYEVEDGKLKLGVWINDKLYKDEYFEAGNYEKYLYGRLGIYPPWEGTYIEIESVTEPYVEPENPEVLDSTLQQITFDDFNIANGRYDHVPGKDFVAVGDYNGAKAGSLANKVINGNITFSEHAWLYVGGDIGYWYGFSLRGSGSDLILTFGGQEHRIKSKVAGTQLVGEEFNLKLSFQVEDGKLKLGVWINDKLYKNQYFETENYEAYLHGRLGIYPPWEGTYIEIESVTEAFVGHKEVLNPKLKQITFIDFGIKDGTYYHSGDFTAWGEYNSGKAGSLANTVVCGDVTFSKSASWLYIGGDDGLWSGLSLRSSGDNLILSFGGKEYPIKSGVAGLKLVENKFNLKISYEVENEQLKLGVWINDTLYMDTYFYLKEYKWGEGTKTYENYLYGRLGIFPHWSKEEGNSWMTIASWEKPAKIYGSVTGSPFVGDTHYGLLYAGMILVASATLLVIGIKTTKKKRQ